MILLYRPIFTHAILSGCSNRCNTQKPWS